MCVCAFEKRKGKEGRTCDAMRGIGSMGIKVRKIFHSIFWLGLDAALKSSSHFPAEGIVNGLLFATEVTLCFCFGKWVFFFFFNNYKSQTILLINNVSKLFRKVTTRVW